MNKWQKLALRLYHGNPQNFARTQGFLVLFPSLVMSLFCAYLIFPSLNLGDWQNQPYLFLGFYLSIGSLFFALWNFSKKNLEYITIACFCFVQAATHALKIPVVQSHFQNWDLHQVALLLSSYQGSAALLFGMTLARTHKRVLTWMLFPLIALPALFAWQTSDLGAIFWQKFSYLTASFACLLQLYFLLSTSTKSLLQDHTRLQKLMSFSLLSFTLFIFHSPTIIAFCMITTCVLLVFRFKNADQLIESTQISKYHRRSELPKALNVYLFTLDLKNSEQVFKAGSLSGLGSFYMQQGMNYFWEILLKSDAEIIQSEGDSITCFWEVPHYRTTAVRHAIQKCQLACEQIEKIWRDNKLIDEAYEVHFRSALCYGEIAPIWNINDGKQTPGWMEAGHKNIFVELSRLLEGEKTIASKKQTTLLIAAEYSHYLQFPNEQILNPEQIIEGKHGNQFKAFFVDLDQEQKNLIKSAS